MNNWYTYKLLADSYAADRHRDADAHRRARAGARQAARPAGGASSRRGARSAWRSFIAAIRSRRPAAAPDLAAGIVRRSAGVRC